MDATLTDLTRLLAESPAAAKARGLGRWANTWTAGTPLLLHGAGQVGVHTLRVLRSQGIEPVAFVDTSTLKQGSVLDGLPVLSPAQAASQWADQALFLVTIINRDHSYFATVKAYAALGVARTAPVLEFFWANPEACLPYYAMSSPEVVLEGKDEILDAFDALTDPASRDYLYRYIRWRLHLDYDALPGPCGELEYFPHGLVSLLGPQCYVDCGAYDGDTLQQFLAHAQAGLQSAHLFEPDPSNFANLTQRIHGLPGGIAGQVSLYRKAAGSGSGLLPFQCDGAESSALSDHGNVEVEVVALDTALIGVVPTFLKMDIEGHELEALKGASRLIRDHRPTLAICVYHRPDHPWKVPLMLKNLLPEHRIAIRPHAADGWEWVAYAVPPA